MIRIITDTASDVTPEEAERNGILLLPMPIQFGETTYMDKFELTAVQFYEKLASSGELPKTSQITPFTFEETFQAVRNANDSAVVIVMSGELSGTAQNAMAAAAGFDEIYVVDSRNVTVGEKCLISLALKLREEGHTAVQIAEILNKRKEDICVLALLDTLEYLKKGGRISATTAWAGGLLSIKPVVAVKDGKVQILGKARGTGNGNNLLIQQIKENGGIDFSMPITLGYSGLHRKLLDRYIEDSRSLWEASPTVLPVIEIGSTIGTHIGPGTVAVAFFHL